MVRVLGLRDARNVRCVVLAWSPTSETARRRGEAQECAHVYTHLPLLPIPAQGEALVAPSVLHPLVRMLSVVAVRTVGGS